jgi:hypothetical protein
MKRSRQDSANSRTATSSGFTLPEGADGGKVSAEFKDGVLKVYLPKNEKAKAKAVEVKVTRRAQPLPRRFEHRRGPGKECNENPHQWRKL